MTHKKLMKTTTNPSLYRKARKRYLEISGKIRCGYCPYHKFENAKTLSRTWKRHRRKQWRKAKPTVKALVLVEDF